MDDPFSSFLRLGLSIVTSSNAIWISRHVETNNEITLKILERRILLLTCFSREFVPFDQACSVEYFIDGRLASAVGQQRHGQRHFHGPAVAVSGVGRRVQARHVAPEEPLAQLRRKVLGVDDGRLALEVPVQVVRGS